VWVHCTKLQAKGYEAVTGSERLGVSNLINLVYIYDGQAKSGELSDEEVGSAADHSPSNEEASMLCCRRVFDDRRSLLSFYG